jgi:molecular chaperone GrpE (heat shock protein)
MMNGGRQHLDDAEHIREQEMQKKVVDLERQVDHLERALQDSATPNSEPSLPEDETA